MCVLPFRRILSAVTGLCLYDGHRPQTQRQPAETCREAAIGEQFLLHPERAALGKVHRHCTDRCGLARQGQRSCCGAGHGSARPGQGTHKTVVYDLSDILEGCRPPIKAVYPCYDPPTLHLIVAPGRPNPDCPGRDGPAWWKSSKLLRLYSFGQPSWSRQRLWHWQRRGGGGHCGGHPDRSSYPMDGLPPIRWTTTV